MNVEIPKRLQPTGETLRELYAKSGNLCSFPGCAHLVMDATGNFIAQVCHIEAAEPGGERFNALMNNEERRSASNLMLMCYAHHVETNDVSKFTVQRLQQMKADHEYRFSRPDRAMVEQLKDWTKSSELSKAQNLNFLISTLGWNIDLSQRDECLVELADYVDLLHRVPVELRKFLCAVVERTHLMKDKPVVTDTVSGTRAILATDLAWALQLNIKLIYDMADQLNQYRLGGVVELETDIGLKYSIAIYSLRSDWPIWTDLAQFCELTSQPLSVFAIDLDFARLDA